MSPDAISELCFESAGSQAFLNTLHFCCHRGGYAKTTAPDLIHFASASDYFPGSRCAFRDAEIEDGGKAFDFINGLPAAGIKLHRNSAQGSDGKLGNHFVEVKTITPFKSKDEITLNLDRNFSKVLIVKIDEEFEVQSKMIDRKVLPKKSGSRLRLRWADFEPQTQKELPSYTEF